MFRKIVQTTAEAYKKKLQAMRQTPEGSEIPDPDPVDLPFPNDQGDSLIALVNNMLRTQELKRLQESEIETPEEAEDFDLEEDDQAWSPYEMDSVFSMWNQPYPPPVTTVSSPEGQPLEPAEAPGGEPKPALQKT